MRIIQLTPGTGRYHCGNCVRDVTLVRALRRLGHDAVIVPMYLPLVADDPLSADDTPIFFGGVNVYLQQKSSIFRHTPAWLDRVFDAPGLLRWAAARAGMTRPEDLGELTISMLRGEDGHQVKELDKLVSWLREHHRPDVISLSNALLVGVARRLKEALNVPVVCSLQGEDAFLDALPADDREASWGLLAERAADVDAFVAVSRYFGDVMGGRLKLPAERVHVVYNGIDLDGFAAAEIEPDPPVVGYLARMCPEKGLDFLVEAFIRLKAEARFANVRLRVAGAMTPGDGPFVQRLRERLSETGLMDHAEFLPNLDAAQKHAFLQSLSVLSVPALSGEAFGLYVLEALASGVPVVQPRHAAFPELIEATGGGLLCEPGDSDALAEAIGSLLDDHDRRRSLGRQGQAAVREKFHADRMARDFAGLCERLVERRTAPRPASVEPVYGV